jgi:hypothetical protein
MSKSETKSFALNDMKVVMPDANTAIVTCQARLDGSLLAAAIFPASTTAPLSGG